MRNTRRSALSLAPNAQHWLMPIEEYYLRGFEPRANGSLAVAFVCTEALDAGVRAVAARWDLRAPPATEATTYHASPNKSHGGMLAPANAAYVRALYARDAALHAAHCKNDVSFVRYGPVTGPKKGPRSEWGPSERRAYGRSRSTTRGASWRPPRSRGALRCAARAREAARGRALRCRGIGELRGRRGRARGRSFTAIGVKNATERSRVVRASTSNQSCTLPPAHRPFFDLVFDINEPIRNMAAGALR